MMLTQLHIHSLRTIHQAQLPLHPQWNFFTGPNGSGKTSLLEAIYLLGTGHSFRTREVFPLISDGQDTVTIFSRNNTNQTLSIQKSLAGPTQVKLNNQFCRTTSELAYFLPCQLFYQDIFHIMDAGPALRRSVLDWGLFHVKHQYLPLWKDYRRAIKQRNALLRKQSNLSSCLPWDTMLSEFAEAVHALRLDYFTQLSSVFQDYLQELTNISCTIEYYKGWDRKKTGKSLLMVLTEQFNQDKQRQYTFYGPHQADLVIEATSSKTKARYILSRGQQKMVLIALKLAQVAIMQKPCVFLLDDLAAELDAEHFRRLLTCLNKLPGQKFLTAIDLPAWVGEIFFNKFAQFSCSNGIIEPLILS